MYLQTDLFRMRFSDLLGIYLSPFFFLLISGDPRLGGLLSWISCSTYGVTPRQAIFSAVTAFCLLLLMLLCRRWATPVRCR